jgi:sulfur carrier protein
MAETTTDIRLTLNGEARAVPDGLTVRDLLAHLGRDPEAPGVAVAVGDRVVRRADWAATAVRDGDRVEVVTAAQGG